MKKLILLVIILGFVGLAASRETYRVTVTRKESNLYKIDGTKTYIKTKHCEEYCYSEQAVLVYERYSTRNKLIFDKRPGKSPECEVEDLLTGDK